MTSASTDFFPYQRGLIDEYGLSVSGAGVALGERIAFLTPGPTGRCGLSHTENGRTRRLASVLDPAAEDAAFLGKFSSNGGSANYNSVNKDQTLLLAANGVGGTKIISVTP